MGQVYVIRKQGQVALPMGNNMMYLQGMENSGPQVVQGVNQAGVGGLQQNPMTQQYEATPQMDESGKNEIGVYEGDKYGARGLNINPQFNQNLAFGPMTAEQAPIHEAQKKVFDRSAKYGQRGANVGRGLAAGIGVLAGAVNLANAGAQGQDALTGGLGAAQMGSVAYQQSKKPLSEAGGEVGAQVGARGVKVETPQVASPTPVAVAPPTHTEYGEDQMTNYGVKPIMSTNIRGEEVPFQSEMARTRAMRDTHGDSEVFGTRISPANTTAAEVDEMGMPVQVERKNGMVAVDGGPPGLDVGAKPREQAAAQQARNVNVAPATTNTPEPTAATSGAAIAAETQLPGATPQQTGEIIAAAKNPAAEATDTEASMASQGHAAKKMVGIVGNKRIVGVI